MQVELQRESRKNVPLFPIRIKFFGTIQQNKKGLSLRASLFLFFVVKRSEKQVWTAVPCNNASYNFNLFFFDTQPVRIRRRSENLQKQPFAYIKCFTPKALPTSIGLLHVFVFPARFFTPSLSVKNIYHHKFYNKKAFFTQKNLFFTQFCYVLFI